MTVDIDEILEAIGEFGTYQRRVYFLLCLPVIFVGASSLSYVFIAAEPKYRCYIHGCDKDIKHNPNYDEPFLNFTIPKKNNSDIFESCYEFARSDYNYSSCQEEDFSLIKENCQNGYVFDRTVYHSTIITEFNLTCANGWEANADQSIYFAGSLVGALSFGILSDFQFTALMAVHKCFVNFFKRFGRRKTIMTGIVVSAVSGITVALVPSMFSFHIMRFINAMAQSGVFQTVFILGLEFVGPGKRVMFGIIGEYFFAFGEVLLGLLAWVLKSWRMLQLVISAPILCFIFYYWVIPESIRWLQAKGRHAKVVAVLEEMAKINKTTIPLHLLRHQADDTIFEDNDDDLSVLLNFQQKVTFFDIFSSFIMSMRTLFMIFIWISTTLAYYGLSFNASILANGSGPYVNFIFSSLAEIPGYSLAWIGMAYGGRKISLVLSLLLSGISCAVTGFVGGNYLLIVFLIGKCFITSAFAIIYVFTAEIFPTSLRNTVVGICSMFARIGGMLAPFSTNLSQIYGPLPLLVFGGLSLISSLFSLVMPETLNTKLPDTLAEAINLGKPSLNAGLVSDAMIHPEEEEKLLNNSTESDLEPNRC